MTSLTLVRRIAARPSIVFDALTTPAGIACWWGPDDGPVLLAETDLRVGGRACGEQRRTQDRAQRGNEMYFGVSPAGDGATRWCGAGRVRCWGQHAWRILRNSPPARSAFPAHSAPAIPQHARAVRLAHHLAAADQAVQVRHALPGGHAEHVQAHHAAEQDTEEVNGALRCGEFLVDAHEPPLVPGDERRKARMQSAKRLVV